MSPWLLVVVEVCLLGLLASAVLCLYRIGIGPRTADRAVAFDTLSMVLVGIVCLLCMLWESTLYFDAVWIITLVGFLGTAAIARYLAHGRLFP
jgi:multisubunit Na+/H+ antiporter MnhF subunit